MPLGPREPEEPPGPPPADTPPGHGRPAYGGAAERGSGASSSFLRASSSFLTASSTSSFSIAQPDFGTSSPFLPASAFREILTRLADDYEQMHAAVTSLSCRQEESYALPAMLPKEAVIPPAEDHLSEGQEPAVKCEERPVHEADPSASKLLSGGLFPKELSSSPAVLGGGDRSYIFDSAVVASSRRSRLGWCLNWKTFESTVLFFIVLNVICLGISVDVGLSEVDGSDVESAGEVLQSLEMGFLIVCTIEIAIRLASSGKKFFLDPKERAWNIFDLVLVLQSGFEQASVWLRMGGLNLAFLRTLRLLRITKMLRVIRLMRSLKELRMILYAVMGSMKGMFWSTVLVVMVLYMFALIFCQGVLDYIVSNDAIANGLLDDDVLEYWGSVGTAMQTLFQLSCGGADWAIAVEPLTQVGPYFRAIFFVYITFFMFVVVNTVTSLFVEAMIVNASNDCLNNIHNEMEKKETYVNTLAQIFDGLDENHDGMVTLEEFMLHMKNPKLLAFFASLNITITDGAFFFKILSEGGTTPVVLEDFVMTCIRIRGSAQAVDLHHLAVKQSRFHQKSCKTDQRLEASLRQTQRQQDSTNRLLEALGSNSVLVGRESVEADGTRVAPALPGVEGLHAEPLRHSDSVNFTEL